MRTFHTFTPKFQPEFVVDSFDELYAPQTKILDGRTNILGTHFRTTFQRNVAQIEYSPLWKALRKTCSQTFVGLSKSSFGEHKLSEMSTWLGQRYHYFDEISWLFDTTRQSLGPRNVVWNIGELSRTITRFHQNNDNVVKVRRRFVRKRGRVADGGFGEHKLCKMITKDNGNMWLMCWIFWDATTTLLDDYKR